jgi:hypothetical protein
MPTGLQPIREALDGGFSVEALRRINHLCFEALGTGPLRGSAVLLFVAQIAGHVADAWDDKSISVQLANRVEQAIAPQLRRLINMVDSPQEDLCAAMDQAANAFAAQVTLGLDSDLTWD